LKLFKILQKTGITLEPSYYQLNIEGLAYNSREVKKDYLFIAIKGFSTDGHQYISKAIENGASFIVIEKLALLKKYNISHNNFFILYKNRKIPFLINKDNRLLLSRAAANYYNHPSKKVKLIGITGTNGKTTISYLIEHILKAYGFKVGVIGTINYRIGRTIIKAKTTTPESLDLQYLFHEMIKKKADYIILEVSSHSLALNRVADCHFNHVIFTNLTEDHFDFHTDINNYFQAKKLLFKLLVKSEKQIKCGFININDKYGRKIYNQYKQNHKIAIFSCGVENKADFQAKNINMSLEKIEFDFKYKNKNIRIKSKLTGYFNIHNILAAIGVGIAENLPVSFLARSVASFKKVPGRLEIIKAKDFYVGIDYAHTEDALKNVLRAIKDLQPARIISIFGCGGDRDKQKRPLMGAVATEYSDFIIVTSDNPRSEDPVSIVKDIEAGIKKKSMCDILKLLIEKKRLKREYLWPGKEILYLSQGKAMRIIRL